MEVSENIQRIKAEIGDHIKLIAVSKTRTSKEILAAYQAGQKQFGENKVQELLMKYHELPKDIEWHLLGHLQTNKVKYVTPFISMIQSVDSLKLLHEINKEGIKSGRIIPCLLQFHIACEETKFGMNMEEAKGLLESPLFLSLRNIRISGVMGMASFTDDTARIRKEFQSLKHYFSMLRSNYFKDKDDFREISMGMSDDYLIAIEEGSTMIRIGTKLFGKRT